MESSERSLSVPEVGKRYIDAQGRIFVVEAIDGESHLGRNVTGRIVSPYSTDTRTFAHTWREVHEQ